MKEIYLYNRKFNKSANYNLWMMFPDITAFSLSALGFLWLFKIIDETENINVERICTDTIQPEFNPTELDAIGVSFSFDFDFLGMFHILDKYHIPFKSADREKDTFKNLLVFGGGPVLTANPEPYKEFFDFILIGDGDDLNKKVLDLCCLCKQQGKNKLDTLKLISEMDGIYVPKFPKQVKKVCCDIKETIHTPILSEESFFKKTFIVEVSRGCPNRCGFCIASYLNMPVRFADYNDLIAKLNMGLDYTNKIALLGALVSSHPRFYDIIDYIAELITKRTDIELSISSIRADSLTPKVIQTLVLAGQKSVTIAIEAGSESLRKTVNKNLSEEQIKAAVKMCHENGLKGIKIYSIIGLPNETEDDLYEFIRLAKVLKSENKGFNITFSFSSFVPKPHTPFQFCKRENINILEKKEQYLKKEFHKLGLKTRFSSIKWDYYQSVLSNGDSSLSDYLVEVYNRGGKLGAFRSAAKDLKINTDKFICGNHGNGIISMMPDENYLKKEYERLIKIK